eukprot:6491019-Amphidinium_carterae.2
MVKVLWCARSVTEWILCEMCCSWSGWVRSCFLMSVSKPPWPLIWESQSSFLHATDVDVELNKLIGQVAQLTNSFSVTKRKGVVGDNAEADSGVLVVVRDCRVICCLCMRAVGGVVCGSGEWGGGQDG